MNIHENRLEATVTPINELSLDTELSIWLLNIETHLETVLTK